MGFWLISGGTPAKCFEFCAFEMYHLTTRMPAPVSVFYFLPLANEVWGKVMFLHLCVILFTGGGMGGVSVPTCTTDHITRGGSLSRESLSGGLCPGASLSRGSMSEGLCPGGSLSRGSLSGGVCQEDLPPVWYGTHPTGMHSCFCLTVCLRLSLINTVWIQ